MSAREPGSARSRRGDSTPARGRAGARPVARKRPAAGRGDPLGRARSPRPLPRLNPRRAGRCPMSIAFRTQRPKKTATSTPSPARPSESPGRGPRSGRPEPRGPRGPVVPRSPRRRGWSRQPDRKRVHPRPQPELSGRARRPPGRLEAPPHRPAGPLGVRPNLGRPFAMKFTPPVSTTRPAGCSHGRVNGALPRAPRIDASGVRS